MSKLKIKLNWIISLFIVFIFMTIAISYTAIVFADGNDNIKEYITMADCEIAGENWLKQNYKDETTLDEIIPILSKDGIESYCINFEKNAEPNGYLVLNADKYSINYIKEFSLSGEGIYQTLKSNSGITDIDSSEEKLIYSLGGYNYAIPITANASKFYSTSNEVLTKSNLNSLLNIIDDVFNKKSDNRTFESKKEYYEGFFTSKTIPNDGTFVSYTVTDGDSFLPSTMGQLRNSGGYNGNCGATAVTNLLSFYREERGFTNLGTSRQDIYNKFVEASGWNEFGEEGLSVTRLNNGMKKLVQNAGYELKLGEKTYTYRAEWTADILKNYPVYTVVRGLINDGGTWEEVGHAMVAVGYRAYHNDGSFYFRVYDGWNPTNDKYIWFNPEYFTSINGYSMQID